MVFLLINFLVAFLGFIAFLTILSSSKRNENSTNYYFLTILFWLTIRRFFYSFIFLFEIEIQNTVKISSIEYLVIPLFYLFIKKFVRDKISLKENLFHLTLATLFFLGHSFYEINGMLRASLFFVFATIYFFFVMRKSIHIHKRNEKKQNIKIKKKLVTYHVFSYFMCVFNICYPSF